MSNASIPLLRNFGNLLPRVLYLRTPNGRAAYTTCCPHLPPPDRTRPISTPAIGLQPLESALSPRFPYSQCVLVVLWGHGPGP
ncbi:hypothetical protein V1508DRAFT_424381 [Lipomyces doorenjongii]|uniref:uncharacterized protein n=1 Tax=Lipomyces doorenjongii TaxID=383834 RepID=UPI0034CDAE44